MEATGRNRRSEESDVIKMASTKTRANTSALGRREEIKEIIEEALEPIKSELANLPGKEYFDDVIDKLSTKVNEKLVAQEERIKLLEDRLDIIESKLVILEHLEGRIDDGEQYSRRHCLRLLNVPLPSDGTKEDCLGKVNELLNEADCGVSLDSVDRAHRIGKISKDDKGLPRQQMIVRFKTFSQRTKFYRARKKLKDAKVRLDLTRRRLNELHKAEDFAKKHEGIEFVFADINCNLAAKFSDESFFYFSTVDVLSQKIGKG